MRITETTARLRVNHLGDDVVARAAAPADGIC